MGRNLSYKMPTALKEALEKYDWNLRTLARVAGLKEQMLYDNLKGTAPMSLGTALKIVKALRMDSPDNEVVKLLKQLQKQHEDWKRQQDDN